MSHWVAGKNHMRQVSFLSGLAVFVSSFLFASAAEAQNFFNRGRNQRAVAEAVSADQVRRAIENGIKALKGSQKADGSWAEFGDMNYDGGVTALCTLALLNAVDNRDDRAIAAAIEDILPKQRRSTYVVGLRIMVLATFDPEGKKYLRAVQNDIDWLVDEQINGGWAYGGRGGVPDASNSQFALLALHEAAQMGAVIPDKVWERTKAYWQASESRGGGYSYHPGSNDRRRAMAAAGLASMIIIEENLPDIEKLLNGERVECCGTKDANDHAELTAKWLGDTFNIRGRAVNGSGQYLFYFLYGLERAGRLSGRRFFGDHDWYREGASFLVSRQDKTTGKWNGVGPSETSTIATAMALLFLSKGKRPIAIGKYLFENREDELHRKGVHYLSRNLEKAWNQKLNWQDVRGTTATADDLLETPVLFMSGNGPINLTDFQKQNLKQYLENGGFLFAEACQGDGCGDAEFDRSFRMLMRDLFPESPLELLPQNHPVWTAFHRLDRPDERPLFGLQACCKTSVIYCPRNLSCFWNVDRPGVERRMQALAPRYNKLLDEIQYATKVGVNVTTYATGRELKDKGDTPKLDGKAKSVLVNRSLELPKLIHGGGHDEAPNAWRNMQRKFGETGSSVNFEKKFVSADLEQLGDYPFVFMHGRKSFSFTPEEREALRVYLQVGGFIFADSICSSPEFTESFRNEMQEIMGVPLQPIPASHPIWNDTDVVFKIETVTLRKKRGETGKFDEIKGPPELEGASYDGRLAVVFSPHDLSCAMENAVVSQCEGYRREDAERIGVNVLLYRLMVE